MNEIGRANFPRSHSKLGTWLRQLSALATLAPGLLTGTALQAQTPSDPPRQVAEIVEVRIVSSDRNGGSNEGRGWAVDAVDGRGCEVLTPAHVVYDRTGRVPNIEPAGETRVFGIGSPRVGIAAFSIEKVSAGLDLARVTLDTDQPCPFSLPRGVRLPDRGLVLWWLNNQNGIGRRIGDDAQDLLPKDGEGSISEGFLRRPLNQREIRNGVAGGLSGATVVVNGRRAGMVTDAGRGQADSFVFLTARGVQRALGSQFVLFNFETAQKRLTKTAKSPTPFVDARTTAPDVEAPVITDDAQLREFSLFKDCAECPEMVVIPAGTFIMGSPKSEAQRNSDEGPQHPVSVPAFALAATEVTFAQWDACVLASGCSHWPDDRGWGRGNRPVINVSWEDSREYLRWLNQTTGAEYRLPSEAEWEYAARATTLTRFHTGGCITTGQANFFGANPARGCPEGEFRGKTTEVGSFALNAFGLFDMHGNVWEWVADCWNNS